MPNPLDALKKASAISATPAEQVMGNPDLQQVRAEMPILPMAGAALSGLSKLKHLFTGGEAAAEAAPLATTLGEVNPEFAPMGAEAAYNAGKKGLQHGADTAERLAHDAWNKYIAKFVK